MKRLLFLLLLPLAACSTPDSNDISQNLLPLPPKATSYQCDSGNRIIMTHPSTETVELQYKQETLSIHTTDSTDGSRYLGNGFIWSTNGQEAFLFKTNAHNEPRDLLERCTQVLK